MKIEYRRGNLLDTEIKHIIHGCNAQGVFNAGVAKQIRTKYPSVYTDYINAYNSKGLSVGDIIFSAQADGKIICNAITQQNYGRISDIVYVSYWAIAEIFRCIERLKIAEIAMPRIGAGLGGGDWSVIEAIIENTLKTVKPVVYDI